MKKIVIIGGGTFSHVRTHLSLATPAFGNTARQLAEMFESATKADNAFGKYEVNLELTKMADSINGTLVTNEDVAMFVDRLVTDPDVRCIIFNVALTDFDGEIGRIPSSKYATRMESRAGETNMVLTPAQKIISRIRESRKDIFVVGFKTTSGADEAEQYSKALRLLKTNSINLVLANDVVTHQNFIVAPEETRYCVTDNRRRVLQSLVKITMSRLDNTFTRSTVIPGHAVAWDSEEVPANLREVVNFCIDKGAYKPVLGKTVGHFAVKVDDQTILTSIRKSNFNELPKVGLVRVVSQDKDNVLAHGFRPSVGGQSQRIIFGQHPELDCIVHFHCPVRTDINAWSGTDRLIPMPSKPQWPNECGSHECGRATSEGLTEVDLGDGDRLKVVMLEDHGPNIVFSRTTPAYKVKQFITSNFDLSNKTGGIVHVD